MYQWKQLGDIGQDGRMDEPIDLAPPARRKHIIRHQVSGRVSDRFIAEMDTALQRIPTTVIDQIVANGNVLAFVETVFEIRPDLRGKTPVGMPPGTTFENLRGFFDAETKTLYVPEYYRPRLQPARGLVKNDKADAVLRHEIGHAVDRVFRMASDTQEFQQAYRADVDKLNDDLLNDFAYFWQHHDDARNRRELFAELFADHYGGGPHDDSRRIRHVFSRCNELIKKKLQEDLG